MIVLPKCTRGVHGSFFLISKFFVTYKKINIYGLSVQVKGAISAIRYTEQFPRLPADFEISGQRDADLFDLLEYVFGFQVC